MFTILIEEMSRHLIWRLLHSHMFYNSEQVSQRYAKMRIENFYIPKMQIKKNGIVIIIKCLNIMMSFAKSLNP
jgi:thymidylate synthase ThyX